MRTLFLLLLSLFTLHAEHIHWYGDYEKAHIQAIEEQKALMVLLVKRDCPECNQMLTSTLKEQTYIPWINEQFITILITKDQVQSYPIEMLYTLTYPAIFFLTPEELFLSDPIIGYVTPEVFQEHIRALRQESGNSIFSSTR